MRLNRPFQVFGVALTAAVLAGCGSSQKSATSVDDAAMAMRGGETAKGTVSVDEAMARLEAGNRRFVNGETVHPRSGIDRVSQTGTGGQYPFVSVLSCADSRVPVERVFDQGVGDVFVVRVAGNIAGAHEAGSLEFGVGALGTNLVVVMGHTKCGAVNAVAQGAQLSGNLASLAGPITPAVEETKDRYPSARGEELTELAVPMNAMRGVYDLLANSSALRSAVRSGDVKIVAAVYDLESGQVEFLGEHPRQAELLRSGG
jgi:carbonic anhydrase